MRRLRKNRKGKDEDEVGSQNQNKRSTFERTS